MKLFIEDLHGYVAVIDDVNNVSIMKRENKNYLLAYGFNHYCINATPLAEIRLAWLADVSGKDIKEYFRYKK